MWNYSLLKRTKKAVLVSPRLVAAVMRAPTSRKPGLYFEVMQQSNIVCDEPQRNKRGRCCREASLKFALPKLSGHYCVSSLSVNTLDLRKVHLRRRALKRTTLGAECIAGTPADVEVATELQVRQEVQTKCLVWKPQRAQGLNLLFSFNKSGANEW